MRRRTGVHLLPAFAAGVLMSAMFGGCTIWLTDQEAFQTGKVLERGQVQATPAASASTRCSTARCPAAWVADLSWGLQAGGTFPCL
jgi:hypothetical protein